MSMPSYAQRLECLGNEMAQALREAARPGKSSQEQKDWFRRLADSWDRVKRERFDESLENRT